MGSEGKRKWEKEFEKYKTINIDEEIKKLEEKRSGAKENLDKATDEKSYKDARRELREETKPTEEKIEKLKKIKENLPKVEKVIKTKEGLTKKLEKLVEEKRKFDRTKELGKQEKELEQEAAKLDQEMEKLTDRRNQIYDAMKTASPEEKAKLEEELKQNEEASKQNKAKYDSNREKFSNNQNELQSALQSPLAKRDFDKEIETTKTMISKCNFMGNKLMQGKSMDDITVDLKNWKDRKLADKSGKVEEKRGAMTKEGAKPEEKKPEEKKPEEKGGTAQVKPEEKKHEEEKDVRDTLDNDEAGRADKDGKNDKDNKPAKINEFFEKHPRLAKIKNFFVKAYKNIKDRFTRQDEQDMEEEARKEETKGAEGKENDGKLTPEQIAERKSEFYRRLAETGKYGKDPVEGKLTTALHAQDEVVKNNDDEGR